MKKISNQGMVKFHVLKCMLDLSIDTFYLSSVNINMMIACYGTLENFPYFLERCKMDVGCFEIQLFILFMYYFIYLFIYLFCKAVYHQVYPVDVSHLAIRI